MTTTVRSPRSALFDLVPEVEVEIGYWAHPDARGTGVTTRPWPWWSATRSSASGSGGSPLEPPSTTPRPGASSRPTVSPWGIERASTPIRTGFADTAAYDLLL